MRKFVTPVVTSAVISLSFLLAGCSVKVQAGPADEPKPKPAKTAEKPKPAKKRMSFKGFKKKKNEIELPAPVPFKSGSAELDSEAGADEILTIVKEYMEQNPDVTLLRIEGHTDSDGDDNLNMALSKARSASVAKWLVDNGVKCNRLYPVGFGETRPLAANDTPENKALNRRVSFFDATVKSKPVNGDDGKPIPLANGGEIAVDPCNPAVAR